MRYKVEDEIFDHVEDVLEYCIDSDYHSDDSYFEEWVNDNYTAYEIISDNYSESDLIDSFCERMNEDDWDNARYELVHGSVGDEVYCQAYTIEIIDDEEEETGNFDGDEAFDSVALERSREEKLAQVRTFIEEQSLLNEDRKANEKKEEEDVMSLFQVIGG